MTHATRYCVVSIIYLMLLSICTPLFAHELGVVAGSLTQTKPTDYRIEAKISENMRSVMFAPQLPSKCQLNQPMEQPQGVAIFDIKCHSALNQSDTIILPWRRATLLLSVQWLNGRSSRHILTSENALLTISMAQMAAPPSLLSQSSQRYTLLGIEHILEGWDHLLFVIGMLLLIRRWQTLLVAVSSFTIAHSITLAIAYLEWFSLPSRPVEASIALSIVILAYEAIVNTRGQVGLAARRPWLVCGLLGLLHGFGFAGALMELGVPSSEVAVALLFFNLGVELGQLLVIASISLLLAALHAYALPNREQQIQRGCAYAIGGMGMYWFIERSLWLTGFTG